MSPIFLSLDEVVEIHRDMIERYGGSTGIRDTGLLQSAAAMPQASFGVARGTLGKSVVAEFLRNHSRC